MSEVIEQPTTTIAVPKPQPTKIEDGVVRFEDVGQAFRFAEGLADSGMVPTAFAGKPKAILAAIQHGGELGFSPMQSLQSIAVINGKPTVWGDALVALAHKSGKWIDHKVEWKGSGDTLACKYSVVKKDVATPFEWEFSIADAKTAGLLGKGPWSSYPRRMIFNRARAFALRDAFAEELRGIGVREEVEDYQPIPAAAKEAKTFAMDVE